MIQNSVLWVKNPLAIHAENAEGGLVVQGQKIIEVLAAGEKPKTPDYKIFDAGAHVVLPGLVNTHHHFYQTLTRAYPDALNKPLFLWLKSLYRVWAHITPEMLDIASQLALAELLLSGCTLASDHHYIFPKNLEYAIDIQVEAARQFNMRVCLTRGSMSLGEKDGGLPPQCVVQNETDIIKDSERVIDTYHERIDGAFCQIALAPCSPFSVTTGLMEDTAKLAKAKNIRLHTHLAETLDEEEFCLKRFGLRTVDYLEKVGWLSDQTQLAHGIHFNKDEIKALGKAHIGIAHCPSSNMMLGSGICPTLDLANSGCNIGLGVDGSASNDSSNMITELRQALYLQRLKYGADKITPKLIYDWATKGGAKLLGRDDIGEIKVGKEADLALFKLDDMRFSGSHDPLSAVLLCGAEKADRVMIGGSWRVVDGVIEGFDQENLIQKHRLMANKLYHLANS